MATKKKNKFIFGNLDWCEATLHQWQKYIDDNPWENLIDRFAQKETLKGGIIDILAANKETQMESHRKTMKDIMELLLRINELRAEEEGKNAKDMRKGFEDDEESVVG